MDAGLIFAGDHVKVQLMKRQNRQHDLSSIRLARFVMLLLACLMLPFAGCRRAGFMDEKDSANLIATKASEMVDLGDYEAAAVLYRKALDSDPTLVRPHLDLALLLHDRQKDYVRAIYHYKRYLELRSGTEKDDMIRARMKQAEWAFVASRVTVQGADGASAMQLLEENGLLRARLESMEATLKATEKELLDLREAERRRLRDQVITGGGSVAESGPAEVESIDRPVLQSVASPDVEPVRPPATVEPVRPPAIVEPVRPPAIAGPVRPPATADPVRPPVPVATVARPVAPDTPTPVETALIPSLPVTTNAKEPPKAFETATIQRTYTVQRGDTLSRIALKVYGDATRWQGIQAANRDVLGDNPLNVRVGQLLKIP